MNLLPIVLGALAGAAVLLIIVGLTASGGSGISARLDRYASGRRPDAEKQGSGSISDAISSSVALASLNKVVENRDFGANLARDLARADLRLKTSEFLAIWGVSIIGLPLICLALSDFLPTLGNPLVLVIAGVVGLWLPRWYINHRKAGRLKAFNNRLADTITLIANALRAGSSFLQAVELVVRETQPPISTEFGRVIREVNLGLAFDDALANMVRRVRSDDLELMATAITIQHQVGGNLAEILDSIAFTIRERVRIKGEIRTLTAQQRLSGYVVAGLPIGLVAVLFVIAPSFMQPMFLKPPDFLGLPLGVCIMFVGGLFMLMGFLAIRRIVDIEV